MLLPTLSLHLLEFTQNTDLVNTQLRKLHSVGLRLSLKDKILKETSLKASNLNLFMGYSFKQTNKQNGATEQAE